jgi:hypothetical protein
MKTGAAEPGPRPAGCDSSGRRKGGEHPLNEEADLHDIVLANLPAGQTERRIAFAIALAFLGIGAIVVP